MNMGFNEVYAKIDNKNIEIRCMEFNKLKVLRYEVVCETFATDFYGKRYYFNETTISGELKCSRNYNSRLISSKIIETEIDTDCKQLGIFPKEK